MAKAKTNYLKEEKPSIKDSANVFYLFSLSTPTFLLKDILAEILKNQQLTDKDRSQMSHMSGSQLHIGSQKQVINLLYV